MITDEKVKEEFEAWYDDGSVCTPAEKAFYEQFPTDNHEISVGFYAGFRTAERLTRLETLEEIKEIFIGNGSRVGVMQKLDRLIKAEKESLTK